MTAHGTHAVRSEWTENLTRSARHVLAGMSPTLTLSEAKAELASRLRECRRAWEAGDRARPRSGAGTVL